MEMRPRYRTRDRVIAVAVVALFLVSIIHAFVDPLGRGDDAAIVDEARTDVLTSR